MGVFSVEGKGGKRPRWSRRGNQGVCATMLTLYAVCAVAGGVILVIQLALTLWGVDFSEDVHDGGGGMDDVADDHHFDAHDSTWHFRLVSFRSLIAAITFFGLGGGLGASAGLNSFSAFMLALSAGVVAMVIVAWMFHLFLSLKEEGNVRIENALGQSATVYLRIPGKRGGVGKVSVAVQQRIMEYEALTDEEEIPTGSPVTITGIINDHTVEVKRA